MTSLQWPRWTCRKSVLIGVLCAALSVQGVQAATSTRVDDSGTVVSQALVQMRWKQQAPGRGADHSVEAGVRVAVRLNMVPWLNKPVRLYMGLAPASGEPVFASWRTQGRLLPGSLRSGSRVLVYDGPASLPLLEETLDMVLRTDGRALTATQSLQFYFEVDTP